MKNVGVVASNAVVLSALALAACSSATVPSGPEQDKGVDGPGVTTAPVGKEANPYGQPYPRQRIGTKPSTTIPTARPSA